MNIQQLKMKLPFSGFYESIWDAAIERDIEQTANYLLETDNRFEGAECEDIQQAIREITDWRCVWETLARHYANVFGRRLQRALSIPDDIFKWNFESLWSPREYNFATDRIFVGIGPEVIYKLYAQTNQHDLQRLVKARHSTRSGFISFYSNSLQEWQENPLVRWDANQLETLLLAWFETRKEDELVWEDSILEELTIGGALSEALPLDADTVYEHHTSLVV